MRRLSAGNNAEAAGGIELEVANSPASDRETEPGIQDAGETAGIMNA